MFARYAIDRSASGSDSDSQPCAVAGMAGGFSMADQIQTQETPAQPRPEVAAESTPQRFKADMPQIPGVIAGGASRKKLSVNPAIPLGIGIAAVLLVALLGARLVSRPKPVD